MFLKIETPPAARWERQARRNLLISLASSVLWMALVLPPSASGATTAAGHSEHADQGQHDPMEDALLAELDDTLASEEAGFPDPFERPNRGTFGFNQTVDRWVLNPGARAYALVAPAPARRAVRRFFVNLDAPGVLANDLLQREWKDAGMTAVRFVVNTTAGVGGFFDPASKLGLEGHHSDFGQTLALAGMPSGAYLILPVFGPTTVRDGVGTLVGLLFRPTTYLLAPADQLFYTSIYGGGTGLVARDEHADELRSLEESSVDYYAALRNAYYQSRTAAIWERREH